MAIFYPLWLRKEKRGRKKGRKRRRRGKGCERRAGVCHNLSHTPVSKTHFLPVNSPQKSAKNRLKNHRHKGAKSSIANFLASALVILSIISSSFSPPPAFHLHWTHAQAPLRMRKEAALAPKQPRRRRTPSNHRRRRRCRRRRRPQLCRPSSGECRRGTCSRRPCGGPAGRRAQRGCESRRGGGRSRRRSTA